MDDEVEVEANSWAQLAFTSPTGENSGTRHPVPIGKEARELYATFYWKLLQNEHEATTFLKEECSKRNFSTYATPDTSKAAVSNRRRNVINEDIKNGVRNASNRFHEINYRPKSVSPLAVRQSPVPPASTRTQYLDSGETLHSPIQPCRQVVESFGTTLNDTIVFSEDGIYEQESRPDGDVQSIDLCFIPSSSSSSATTTPSIPSQTTAHNSSEDEFSYTTLSKPILVPATFFPVNDNNPPSILDSCRDCEDSLPSMSPLEKNNPPGLDVLKPSLPLYPPIWAQPADDQLAQDKSVRALLTNYRDCRPLALLFDDKYALFPYDLRPKGITYAVLGFYTISHAWG
ncbi:hypothetical protein H0H93_005833 [Arthromyces matolae]|nr:hypothetical protein H0H93_005833 [Arthromyces matolae]